MQYVLWLSQEGIQVQREELLWNFWMNLKSSLNTGQNVILDDCLKCLVKCLRSIDFHLDDVMHANDEESKNDVINQSP